MRYAARVRVDCDDLGKRVSVRSRVVGGYSDVVGILETCDDGTFGVRDRRGALRTIDRSVVVAAKVVAQPPRRR
ncbi:MAG: hypothetical protein ACRDKS_06755 [Actinomycetota bacterium]